MKAFKATVTVSGTNEKPEPRTERILAVDIESATQIVTAAVHSASFVVLKIEIEEDENPFPFVR